MLNRLLQHPVTWWAAVAFIAANAVLIGLDLFLVFHGYDSISWRTWVAEAAHPTLRAAGVLAFSGIAVILKDYWYLAFYTGCELGHLFINV